MEHTGIDSTGAAQGSLKSHVTGFALAIFLTVIPFTLVMTGALPRDISLAGIFTAAVVQILVHLHYFLHLDTSSEQRWNLHAIVFTVLIIAIIMVGTLWIMSHLQYQVGGLTAPAALSGG